MNIKHGKTYWTLSVRNLKLKSEMPASEYKANLERVRKEIKDVIKTHDFATKQQAKNALNKLSKQNRNFVQIDEATPVSLGLGWC
jgi:ribonuclease D